MEQNQLSWMAAVPGCVTAFQGEGDTLCLLSSGGQADSLSHLSVLGKGCLAGVLCHGTPFKHSSKCPSRVPGRRTRSVGQCFWHMLEGTGLALTPPEKPGTEELVSPVPGMRGQRSPCSSLARWPGQVHEFEVQWREVGGHTLYCPLASHMTHICMHTQKYQETQSSKKT